MFLGSPEESNLRELAKLLSSDGSRLSSDLRPNELIYLFEDYVFLILSKFFRALEI